MASPKLYDALVIGGGPAGLSVAQGLSRVHRSCAIFSNKEYRNAGIHVSHNVLTRDHQSPEDFRRIAIEQISKYGTTDFLEQTITGIKKIQTEGRPSFEVSNQNGQTWQGRRLVLATGAKDVFPDIPGYAENWPHNIYQCLFCDGHEKSHLPMGVLTADAPMYFKFAAMMKHMSLAHNSSVTVFMDGPTSGRDAAIQQGVEASRALDIQIDERKIDRLEAVGDEGVNVVLEDGEKVFMGFLVHKPTVVPVAENLIRELGLEMAESPFGKNVKRAEPMGTTDVKGVYVAGDVGTPMTSVPNAMASGSFCAAGIAHELVDEDTDIALEKYKASVRLPSVEGADATACSK